MHWTTFNPRLSFFYFKYNFYDVTDNITSSCHKIEMNEHPVSTTNLQLLLLFWQKLPPQTFSYPNCLVVLDPIHNKITSVVSRLNQKLLKSHNHGSGTRKYVHKSDNTYTNYYFVVLNITTIIKLIRNYKKKNIAIILFLYIIIIICLTAWFDGNVIAY